jgi:hypothetical protein
VATASTRGEIKSLVDSVEDTNRRKVVVVGLDVVVGVHIVYDVFAG